MVTGDKAENLKYNKKNKTGLGLYLLLEYITNQ